MIGRQGISRVVLDAGLGDGDVVALPSLGLVTQTVDPEGIRNLFQKDSASVQTSQGDKPFVREKSVVFSLEFKF